MLSGWLLPDPAAYVLSLPIAYFRSNKMEIDDYRTKNYKLINLITDHTNSIRLQSCVDKNSDQFDLLTGLIKMEAYLVAKSKCSDCYSPQDRRLIYFIEKATYSNFREFVPLAPSHENCITIKNFNKQLSQPGPALTFDMMLSLHDCPDLQSKYNLLRYYNIIVQENDSMAIELYYNEYNRLLNQRQMSQCSNTTTAQTPETNITQNKHLVSLSGDEISIPINGNIKLNRDQDLKQFIIKHYDVKHNYIRTIEVPLLRMDELQIESNAISQLYEPSGEDCIFTTDDVVPTYHIQNERYHHIMSRGIYSQNKHQEITDENISNFKNKNKNDITGTYAGGNVKKAACVANGPNTKSEDMGVWPKWPNIFEKYPVLNAHI